MLEKRKIANQEKKIETLNGRIERLVQDNEVLQSEKKALQNELEICHAKLDCVEKAEQEFMESIEQTRIIKARYEKAYEDLKQIKSRYAAEVNKLIKQMTH